MDKDKNVKIGLGLFSFSLVLILAIILYASPANKLVYVFEVVRHGARAPMLHGDFGFKVGPGILTPMGIR